MIRFKHSGSFKNAERFLSHDRTSSYTDMLNRYGQRGVSALASNTPVDTGVTADSWGYYISRGSGRYTINWTNSHIISGVPIAVIIQYGHGTGSGGYVEGRDYINPAMKSIFRGLADQLYKEVIGL